MSEFKISAKYMKIYVIICGILTGFPGAAILYSQFKNIYNEYFAFKNSVIKKHLKLLAQF